MTSTWTINVATRRWPRSPRSAIATRAALPLRVDLDERLGRLDPAIGAVRDVYELVADGKFISQVVARRQESLLGVASELLQTLSRSRFGLSADFHIVDATTGQPRDTKTLSSGETFLASPALALALVEVTARGGAQVEALFLDEGFGTLDANVLADALDALTQQAGQGRLVAVISHMRDVALHFEDVLMVSWTVGGSHARWLTRDEVSELVAHDTARLLD
jgi:exonuclease SbcC